MPPLFVPGGAGDAEPIDPRLLFVGRQLFGDGAATATLDFVGIFYDAINDMGIIGAESSIGFFLDDFQSRKMRQFITSPSSVTVGSDEILDPRRDSFNNDITLIQDGPGLRELVRSSDESATWSVVPNPPALPSILRRFINIGDSYFVVSDGTPNIHRSFNGGVSWTSSNSGVSGSINIAEVAPDGTVAVCMGNGTPFGVSNNPGLATPTWTIFNTTVLFPGLVGGSASVRLAAWSSDSNRCVMMGTSNDLIYTIDKGASWNIVDRAINPLFDEESVNQSAPAIGYSIGNQGFYAMNRRNQMCFMPDDDMANPLPITVPDVSFQLGRIIGDADGNVIATDQTDGSSLVIATPRRVA